MFERKKNSLAAEPWGELLITVLVLLVGRAGLRWALCQLLAPLQEDLQAPMAADVGEGESEEKKEGLKPIANGGVLRCTVTQAGGLPACSPFQVEQLM